MSLPTIHLVGTMTADPILRFTNGGTPVTNLRVACNERRKTDAGEWETTSTVYLDVIAWRNAEEIAGQLHKGMRIQVAGTLRQRSYKDREGNERVTIEILAQEIGPIIMAQTAYGASKLDADNMTNPDNFAPF